MVEEFDNTDDEDRDNVRESLNEGEGTDCGLSEDGDSNDDCDNDTDISLASPPHTLPNISIPSE
ncbi:hypothetical protein BOTCAL_0034g00110 [Botryotinia calthae]|uniref:Uncharacterized protein n=1 Tax=Botryotinia calthae TaxID=38488 RepID=A0A4Y8DDD7_9HELO|nr:hypothetical protein BOTCAL_0034g00110 [Botryotinia calthae]